MATQAAGTNTRVIGSTWTQPGHFRNVTPPGDVD
jgi:hypothetical protein